MVPQQHEYAELVAAAMHRAVLSGARFLQRAPVAGEFDRLWAVRRYQPGGASSPNCYEVLQETVELPEDLLLLVHGGDLASTEAAVKLAMNGRRVRLSTSQADFCLDAHPGFRALHRRSIAQRGAVLLTSVPPPRAQAGETLIAGPSSSPGARNMQGSDWCYPYAEFGTPAASIDDAYEPGLMTTGVYAAAALALDC